VSAFIGNKGSEIVFVPQKSTTSGSISLENKQQLLQFSGNVDMVVIGPGLSLNTETQTLVRELCAEMFGLGFPINDAVQMGVFLHGFAGDLAANYMGEDGLMASDILNQLPASLKTYRD